MLSRPIRPIRPIRLTRFIHPMDPISPILLTMTILEQALIPKSPSKRSEDGIVVTTDFVAVIDGSTSKSSRRCHRDFSFRRRSNGELAMHIVTSFVRKMQKDFSCHQFCVGVTSAVRRRYKKDQLSHLAQHPEDRLAASVVVFSRLRRELWLIGDCQALLIPVDILRRSSVFRESSLSEPYCKPIFLDNPKPCEQELAERRAAIIKSSPQPWDHFRADDTARKAIIPRMLETMQQQNNGYSVVDGFPVDERHVRVVPLDFCPWEVVLATDGYPFLCPTLAESEEKLAFQLVNDPLNIGEFKATKSFVEGNNSFDDRAYIRFTV